MELCYGGIAYALSSLIQYLNDPSFENFGKIITGIGIAIGGLAMIIGSVPLAVAGAIVTILGLIASNWEKIKSWLDNASSFVDNMITNIKDWFINNIDIIQDYFGYFGVRCNRSVCIISQYYFVGI